MSKIHVSYNQIHTMVKETVDSMHLNEDFQPDIMGKYTLTQGLDLGLDRGFRHSIFRFAESILRDSHSASTRLVAAHLAEEDGKSKTKRMRMELVST